MTYAAPQRDFSLDLATRGYQVLFRPNETNRCPGCGRANWYVGRLTAECGFCQTALPLAETQWSGMGLLPQGSAAVRPRATIEAIDWSERREYERLPGHGRVIQLLIDGAPHAFAVQNISSGGLMAQASPSLLSAKAVQVEIAGGGLLSADVKWTNGKFAGIAFEAPAPAELIDPAEALLAPRS